METPIIMNMNFSKAFEECSTKGKVIGRKTKLKYVIVCQIPAIIDETVIPKLSSLNDNIKDILLSTCKRIHYQNQMLKINVSTGEAVEYIPTAEDLFARDWQLIEGDVLEEIKFRFNKQSLV